MSFDIYGGHLQRGHCEVHPHVHEEYPCSLCLIESDRQRREHDECEAHWRAQANEHYAQMFAEEEYQSWKTRSNEKT